MRSKLPILCLILCLILGCSLRFVGLTRGDSSFVLNGTGQSEASKAFYHFHPDETTVIQAALGPIDPFAPKLTAYGLLPVYLLRGVLELNRVVFGWDFENQLSPDGTRYIYVTARGLSALISCVTLYLVWLVGVRWFDELTGLLAVCVVAAAPIAIQLAHFYTVDSAFTMLILASMYALLRSLERPGWRWFIATGLLIGLAASVRLMGLSVGLVLLVGYVTRQRQLKAIFAPPIYLAGLIAVVVLLALQPYIATNWDLLSQDVSGISFGFGMKVARGETLSAWSLVDVHTTPYLYHWTHLWPLGVGWPLTLLFLFGVSYALWKIDHHKGLILLWAGIYFYVIGGLHTKPIRYLLPLLPFFALLTAAFCAWLVRAPRFVWVRRLGIAICSAAFIYSTAYGIAFAGLYAEEDSRIQAARWIDEHIRATSRIGVERGGFSMRGLIDSKKYAVRTINTGTLFGLRGFMTCQAELTYLLSQLRNPEYLVIIDANRYKQFIAAPELVPGGVTFYHMLMAGELGFDLVQRFRHYPTLGSIAFKDDDSEPTFTGFDHPTVRIFKKRDNAAWQRGQALLRERLSSNPHCVDSLLATASSTLQSGNFHQSLQTTRQVIAQVPQSKLAHLIQAEIYRQMGRATHEAVEPYNAETKKRNNRHLISWASGMSLFDLGLTDLALFVLDSGTRQVPYFSNVGVVSMASAYAHLATMIYDREQQEAAEKVFTLSTQIHPLPMAYFNLAVIALDDEDYKRAATHLEQSLQLDANQANAHAILGKIRAAFLPDPDKARHHIKKAIELDPNLEADLSAWQKLIPNK